MDMMSKFSPNGEIIDDYRCALHDHHDHDRSQCEEQPNERTPSPPPRKKSLSPPQAPSKSTSSKSTHYTSSSSPKLPPPQMSPNDACAQTMDNWPPGPSNQSPPPEVRIIESDTSTKAVKISSDDTETSFQTLEISYDDTRKNRVVVSKANSKSTNISKSDMCEWYLSTNYDEDSTSYEDSSYDD
ncbi:hypothetical protein Tco_0558491 [Tanacetum coccineum]